MKRSGWQICTLNHINLERKTKSSSRTMHYLSPSISYIHAIINNFSFSHLFMTSSEEGEGENSPTSCNVTSLLQVLDIVFVFVFLSLDWCYGSHFLPSFFFSTIFSSPIPLFSFLVCVFCCCPLSMVRGVDRSFDISYVVLQVVCCIHIIHLYSLSSSIGHLRQQDELERML